MPGHAPLAARWQLRLALALRWVIAAIVLEQRPNRHHDIAVAVLQTVHEVHTVRDWGGSMFPIVRQGC